MTEIDSSSRVHQATDGKGLASEPHAVPWGLLVRGIGLGAIHTASRICLTYAVTYWTPLTSPARWVALAIVVVMTGLWGFFDGRRNFTEQRRPMRDLPVFWLMVAVIAGITSGGLVWLIGSLSSIRSGSTSIGFELTTGAAWVLLITYVPAMVGAAIGRRLREPKRSTRP